MWTLHLENPAPALFAALVGCATAIGCVETSMEGDADADTSSDSATGSGDADADADADTSSDSATETDTAPDTATGSGDADADADADADTDADADADTGPATCAGVDVILALDGGTAPHLWQALESRLALATDDLLAVGGGVDEIHLAVIDGCTNPAHYHDWGSTGDCELPGGVNWISSLHDDYESDLSCLASLAAGGGYHGEPDSCGGSEARQPACAAAYSVLDTYADANARFLRDDAMLLVIALTDTDESFASGSAYAIFSNLVAAKGNDSGRVVFLGLGGEAELGLIDPDCDSAYDLPDLEYDVEDSVNMRAVAEQFGASGIYSTVCHSGPNGSSDPITTALTMAAQRLDTGCQSF